MATPLSSLIAASRISAVEMALLQTFGKTEVDEITLLRGGLSGSAVFKMVIDDQPYLLKLSEPSTTITAPPPLYLQLVGKAGIAPPLHYLDAATGVSISAFIESTPIFSLPPDKIISELAVTIKAVHQVTVDGMALGLLKLVDGVVQWLEQSNLFAQNIWDEFMCYYGIIKNKYPWQDTEKVLSHNDLNPSNILWDGKKVWIIDWDVASLNDPYVDLAIAANFFVHRQADEKLLLDVYFGKAASPLQIARFNIMRQVCRIIFAKEMLQRAVQSKPAVFLHQVDVEGSSLKEVGTQLRTGKLSLQTYEGQFMYGKALFNEALQQMRSPQFAQYLTICVAS